MWKTDWKTEHSQLEIHVTKANRAKWPGQAEKMVQ